MKIYIQKTIMLALFCLGVSSMLFAARDPQSPVKKKSLAQSKAAACSPATARALLSFNNVRTRIENGGNMWQNRDNNTPFYEIPAGSNTHSLYAGSLWMGGINESDQLKFAGLLFRNGNDFWPGPLSTDGFATVDDITCNRFDKFFSAFKPDAMKHKAYHDALKEVAEGRMTDAQLQQLFPGYSASGPAYFGNWPAIENPDYAPFEDFDGDGFYDPSKGDYPGYDLAGKIVCRDQDRRVPLFGDTTIYWIFNDKGDVHTESGSQAIGMEIRAQAFAFADKSAINNMTFYNYVLINQGSEKLKDTYFAQWADTDLGNPSDDYVGCDVQRGLGFCYNGAPVDPLSEGASRGYGPNPPAIGIDFFQGPFQDDDGMDNPGPYHELFAPAGIKDITYQQAKDGNGIPYRGLGIGYGDGVPDNERFGMTLFLYHNNDNTAQGNPSGGPDMYNYMRGIWRDGSSFLFGGNGHQSTIGTPPKGADPEILCNYMFMGQSDPVGWATGGKTGLPNWTEATATNDEGDRRFMECSGPFVLLPGQVNNITVGVVWARGTSGGPEGSILEMLKADDIAQGLFDNCFQIFEGPDAPDVAITELDRELILFLSNPASSNNAGEAYSKIRPELTGIGDPVYRFEGYQIFQVKDATVSAADLDDPDKAQEIFQVDIKNFEMDTLTGKPNPNRPIQNLINYEFDDVMKKSVPVLKVQGSNTGIQNSFKVEQDMFATGPDKRLVNNKVYYFMAIAYAHNNYRDFDPDPNQPVGQAEMYVPSRKNGRGGQIISVAAIPHKTEVELGGTEINSVYGLTLPITRIEGSGNGGFFTQMTQESEDRIMSQKSAPFAIMDVDFEEGAGPIQVKVVDPLRVQEADFELRLIDTTNTSPTAYRVSNYMDKAYWVLKNKTTGDTITSNRPITVGGEQLVLDYGISIEVQQHFYGGKKDSETTNLVGSFMTPQNSWLSGFDDNDLLNFTNWIRSGTLGPSATPFYDDLEDFDPNDECPSGTRPSAARSSRGRGRAS